MIDKKFSEKLKNKKMLRFDFLLLLLNFVSVQNATNTNQNLSDKQLGNILYENYTARARKGKTNFCEVK